MAAGPSDDRAKRNIALESEIDHAHHDQVFYVATNEATYEVVEVVEVDPSASDPAQQQDEMLMNVNPGNVMEHAARDVIAEVPSQPPTFGQAHSRGEHPAVESPFKEPNNVEIGYRIQNVLDILAKIHQQMPPINLLIRREKGPPIKWRMGWHQYCLRS